MFANLGHVDRDEIDSADKSTLTIDPSHDECDEIDVNLPIPTCKAIRKVCRNYDSRRRYLPYTEDGSEGKQYNFKVKYILPDSRARGRGRRRTRRS